MTIYLLDFMVSVSRTYKDSCIKFLKLKYKNKGFYEFLTTK